MSRPKLAPRVDKLEMLRSEAEIDAMHDAIVARFPDGLNYEQFAIVTLETADEEGRVYPPPLVNMATFQMMLKMSLDRLLDYRGTHHTPMLKYYFTNEKGRQYLAAHVAPETNKMPGGDA